MTLPAYVLMLYILRGRLCDRIRLKSDRSLCQQSSVYRCAGQHRNVLLSQYNSLKVRARSKRHNIGNLPEDILGLGAPGPDNVHIGADIESSRYLEDPDIIRTAVEGKVRCD